MQHAAPKLDKKVARKLGQQVPTFVHLAINTLILALVLRTWLVMGLIAPVTVSGSSMAPTLVGPHLALHCLNCQQAVRFAVNSLPAKNPTSCPYCLEEQLDWTHAGNHPGTRLWIDRSSTLWRLPQRWEVVVFHSPWLERSSEHADTFCIKRVLGLPGEQVELVAGDVWINGQLHVKTLPEQRLLRQLVRRRPSPVFLSTDHSMTGKQVLFHVDRPLTDEVVYNGRLSRKLHLIHDFMLSARLACQGKGLLEWTVDDGRRPLRIQIRLADGAMRLLDQNRQLLTHSLSESSMRRLAGGEVTLELSTFDRQLMLAIDGRVELQYALQQGVLPVGTLTPFAVASADLAVNLRQITLWRDVYYGPRPVGFGFCGTPGWAEGVSTDPQATWQLAADELFLVGDNAPVSIDSRVWPHAGIPRHLLVGRVLGVPWGR